MHACLSALAVAALGYLSLQYLLFENVYVCVTFA